MNFWVLFSSNLFNQKQLKNVSALLQPTPASFKIFFSIAFLVCLFVCFMHEVLLVNFERFTYLFMIRFWGKHFWRVERCLSVQAGDVIIFFWLWNTISCSHDLPNSRFFYYGYPSSCTSQITFVSPRLDLNFVAWTAVAACSELISYLVQNVF